MTDAKTSDELLALSQKLLDSIMQTDWHAYSEMVDPSLTAFEPEAMGQLVVGLPFHKFYFDAGPSKLMRQATICSPHVRVMGEVAVVSYVRVNQKAERYDTALWIVPTSGGPSRQLTAGPRDANPRWSPDGKTLAFIRSPERDGRPQPPQIFLLSLEGGEARALTDAAAV